MSYPQLSILIPAAGASTRLGQAKQLLHYKNRTLIQNAVNIAHSITPGEIIVVTGANADAVKDAVQHTPVRWAHNRNWSAGMGGSIAVGSVSINMASSGVMILLCDQWRLEASDLRSLADKWQSDPTRIVCAQANNQVMPPVIFPATCFDQLRALDGDTGASGVLQDHPQLMTPITLKNAAYDIDTKRQLEQFTNADL